jgi:hypothetical protein
MHLRIARRSILIVDVLFCKITRICHRCGNAKPNRGGEAQVGHESCSCESKILEFAKKLYIYCDKSLPLEQLERLLLADCGRVDTVGDRGVGKGSDRLRRYNFYRLCNVSRRRSAPRQHRAASNARKVMTVGFDDIGYNLVMKGLCYSDTGQVHNHFISSIV